MRHPNIGLTLIFIISIFCLCSTQTNATEFNVSTTDALQAALNEAASNRVDDIIKIAQGSYSGPFTYSPINENFSVTIQGGYTADFATRVVDPPNTVLSTFGSSGFALHLKSSGTATTFDMDGLTLKNDDITTNGGGLYVQDTNVVTLTNIHFRENTQQGAYITNTQRLTAQGCTFDHNTYEGILIENTNTVTIEHSMFHNNGRSGIKVTKPTSGILSVALTNNRVIQNGSGGAIITANSTDSITLDNNMIYGNKTDAGVSVTGGTITLTKNVISRNSVFNARGANIRNGATVTLANNIISENSNAAGTGAGLFVSAPTVKLINNLIIKNTTSSISGKGSGVYIAGAGINSTPDQLIVTNNTITGNTTAGQGGGIWVQLYEDADSAVMQNNIIYGNTATSGGTDIAINNTTASSVTLQNNDFDQTALYSTSPILIDPSNINADPQFQDAANSIYFLSAGSLCLNVGKNDASEIPTTDLAGQNRIFNNTVDLGAYEYAGQPLTPGELQFSQSNYDATEENGSVTLTVNRLNGSNGAVIVEYATSDGTATGGSDYTAISGGVLTFADGETTANFAIPIISDPIIETSETFTVTLSNPAGGAIVGSPNTATVTITAGCALGDMDCNGELDILDIQMLVYCAFGEGICTNGDVYPDGDYDIFDIQRLVYIIFGS